LRFSAHLAVAATMDGERLFGPDWALGEVLLEMLDVEVDDREEAVDGTRSSVFSFLRISPGLTGAVVAGGIMIVLGTCF
jgi:hypothetical protein